MFCDKKHIWTQLEENDTLEARCEQEHDHWMMGDPAGLFEIYGSATQLKENRLP